MTSTWSSYDSAAAVYGSVSVPLMFRQPASDLVQILEPGRGQYFLDVGAGTGAISREARLYGADVTAVDLSTSMLRQAKGLPCVAARLPKLPFKEDSFDFVASGFVITHIRDYESALLEMKRVLSPSGKIGMAFWKTVPNVYGQAWSEIAETFAGKGFFSTIVDEVLPWEEWFKDPENVKHALFAAGLCSIRIEEKSYECKFSIDQYLASRQISLQGRFLQNQWDEAKWDHFLETLQDEFHLRFQEPLQFTSSVIFGLAQKSLLW